MTMPRCRLRKFAVSSRIYSVTLGDFIKTRRGARTLAWLAEQTGQKTWHGPQSWEERGVVPKAGTLAKIADVLNLTNDERRELSRLAALAEAAPRPNSRSKTKLVAVPSDAAKGEPVTLVPEETVSLKRTKESDVAGLDRLLERAFRQLAHQDARVSDSAKLLDAMRPAAQEIATYEPEEALVIATLWAEVAITLRQEGAPISAPLVASRATRELMRRRAANDVAHASSDEAAGIFPRAKTTLPPPIPDRGETAASIAAAKSSAKPKTKTR
jgi:hypothetical protein